MIHSISTGSSAANVSLYEDDQPSLMSGRADYNSNSNSNGVVSSSVDSDSETLKAAVRRLQFELNVERGKGNHHHHHHYHRHHTTNTLKLKKGKQKLVSGSQFRMPAPGPHRCDQCEELSRGLKKGKEATRTLRLQLQRALEEIDGMKRSRGNNNDEGPAASVAEALMSENKALRIRCDELESINDKYQTSQAQVTDLTRKNEQLIASSDAEMNNSRLQLSAVEATTAQLSIDKENLELQISKLRSNITTYKQQLSLAESKRAEMTKQLKDTEKEMHEGDQLNKEIERLLAEISSLKSAIDDMYLALKASNDKMEIEKAKALAAQEISIKTTLQLEKATNTIDNLEARIFELERLLQGSEQTNRDKSKEIEGMSGNITKLQKEVADKDNQVMELLQRMEAEKEEVKKVVEKAIVSSVRLCVVAPTVNVHIPDKKVKFQSSLPEGQLKKFIDEHVFSKYSTLFKQETDDSSPAPGTPVQAWIKIILSEMQTSIEKHVNNAMESAK